MLRFAISTALITAIVLIAGLTGSQPAQAKRFCVKNDYAGWAWREYSAWGQTRKQARAAARQKWVSNVRTVHGFQFTRVGLARNKRYFCSRCRKTANTITTCNYITRGKLGYETGYYCYLFAAPCVRR